VQPHHSRPVARKPPPRRTGSLKTAPHQPAGMTASLRIADAGIWVLTGESHRSFPFRPELWVGRVLVNPKRGDLISDFHLSGCFCGGESKHDGETAESAPNTNPHRRRALLPGQHLKPATPGRLFEEAPSLKEGIHLSQGQAPIRSFRSWLHQCVIWPRVINREALKLAIDCLFVECDRNLFVYLVTTCRFP